MASSIKPSLILHTVKTPIQRPYRPLSSRFLRLQHPRQPQQQHTRPYAKLNISHRRPPRTDTRPKSDEPTQTDFGQMDIYANMAAPATGIDACTSDGFALNNNTRVSGSGVLLVGGEAFRWRPWLKEDRREGTIGSGGKGEDKGMSGGGTLGTGKLINSKGQWDVDRAAWGLLDIVWPKPDLLILGTGPAMALVSPATRQHISELGIRLEIADTANASAQYNLLATERGVHNVAAALVPMGWREGR